MIKAIYINLPIKDVQKTKNFWTALGFSFEPQFSDEKTLCLIINPGNVYAMLISPEQFKTFTNRPISDTSTTQVINAIQVDSKERVEEMTKAALANGGSRYRESKDEGWMYYDSFADPDGHQWEVIFMDEEKLAALSE